MTKFKKLIIVFLTQQDRKGYAKREMRVFRRHIKEKSKIVKSVSAGSVGQPNNKDLCWLLKKYLPHPETRARLRPRNTAFEVSHYDLRSRKFRVRFTSIV